MKTHLARWARQRAAAALAVLLLAFASHASAQDPVIAPEHEADLAFVLDVLEKDYAGWPTKIEGREEEFAREVDLARERIAENPAARLWAIGMMLEWFEDDHLGTRSKIVSPANPWADQARPGRTFTYTPALSNEFAVTRLSPDTIMVRMPNFYNENTDAIAALLAEHHDAITSTPNLLIDLRGNNGGRDGAYEPLMAYLYTRPIYSIAPAIRATPRNMATLQANVDAGEYPAEVHAWVKSILDRAAASGEEWVPMLEEGFQIETFPQVYGFPKRVGILTEGAASSGDQFVMDARFSRKVTLLGAPTAGVIDYSNMIEKLAPSGDFELYWPMTRSMRLPEEPFDNVGVPVDVAYPEGVTDQIEWAKAWLESRPD
ncbi:S41 family peptidase [Alteriqipengyuania sp. WL0013]|uniref:S41 family peptidase n=1 Tax=Alteriqipengyuania sp. WL0013 TaxID=3110773 RepID=UPI002BFC9E72|nr:S41 family peptidase [Alteriqipengyuania sp. WL0013]MEB3416159.1 S41 family peptidase [Alteriqipengyuania sp. WL0013]